MKIHPLAKYFPILEGDDFDLLVEDIHKNGQREQIVLVGDEILDGVNRWRACEQLHIKPITKQFKGDDPLSYVISLNIRRRHLDVSQRAALATEILPEFEKRARERKKTSLPGGKRITSMEVNRPKGGQQASDDVGKYFGVSGASIERAKRIREKAPEKFREIIQGKTTVRAVDTALREADEVIKDEEYRQKIKDKPKAKVPEVILSTNESEYLYRLRRAIGWIKKPPNPISEAGMREIRKVLAQIRAIIEEALDDND